MPVTVNLAQIIKDNFGKLSKFENGLAIYAKDGFPPEIGDTIVNKDLANTLRLIQAQGADAIYKGDIAAKIVAEVRKRGGILTLEDLASYQVKVRTPVTGSYRGYTIITAPPPSGRHARPPVAEHPGDFDLAALGEQTHGHRALWAEACKLVFADRAKYSADPDFVKVPYRGPGVEGVRQGSLAALIRPDAVMTERRGRAIPPSTSPARPRTSASWTRTGTWWPSPRRSTCSSRRASWCRAPASSWATTWTTST